MEDNYKEVYFGIYCGNCRYESRNESEEPCNSCLDEPTNLNSHKPVNWKEKK